MTIAGDRIVSIGARRIERPLVTTFATALGQKTSMTSIIVEVRLRDGSRGRGECATSFVLPHETPERIIRFLGALRRALVGMNARRFAAIAATLRLDEPHFPMAASGLETAIFRAWLAHEGTSERQWFGRRLDSIETDITVPHIGDEAGLLEWVGKAAATGFRTYKLKVTGDRADDRRMIARVTRCLKDAGVDHRLYLDGNQGFSEKSCLALVDHVMKKGYPVDLIEQPLRKDDLKGLAAVTKDSPIPVILDETVFTARDMELAINEGLGKGVNIKVAKSGISGSLDIMDLAKRHGMKLMAGCMTETMTGLSAGIHMAMGRAVFDYVDLDGVHFLRHGKRYGDIVIDGPRYRIAPTPAAM